MKDLMTYGAYLVIALAVVGSTYYLINKYMGIANHSQLSETLNTISGTKETMKSATLAVEVKDEVIGGIYKVQRAQATSALTDFKFEDDFTGDLTGKVTGKDKIEVKVTGSDAVAGDMIHIADSDKTFKTGDSVAFDKLLCGNNAIPAIIPKDDNVKKNMVLSLLSVKDSSVEKDVIDSGKIGSGSVDDLLNTVFDGEPVDTDDLTKGFKGLVGLQMVNPTVLENAKVKMGKYKGITFYEVCEVKSQEEIKNTLMATPISLSESQATDVAKGIKNLSEGDIVSIPSTVKNMIKDSEGIGVFSSSGRLKRY